MNSIDEELVAMEQRNVNPIWLQKQCQFTFSVLQTVQDHISFDLEFSSKTSESRDEWMSVLNKLK